MLNKIRILAQDSYMDTNLMTLTVKESANNKFIYYSIFKAQLSKIADTSTIPQINNKHIIPYKILFPSLQEQRKIASFLSSIDKKIEAIDKELQNLKQFKKGLLQKMFV